jgi:hypothetical protein
MPASTRGELGADRPPVQARWRGRRAREAESASCLVVTATPHRVLRRAPPSRVRDAEVEARLPVLTRARRLEEGQRTIEVAKLSALAVEVEDALVGLGLRCQAVARLRRGGVGSRARRVDGGRGRHGRRGLEPPRRVRRRRPPLPPLARRGQSNERERLHPTSNRATRRVLHGAYAANLSFRAQATRRPLDYPTARG